MKTNKLWNNFHKHKQNTSLKSRDTKARPNKAEPKMEADSLDPFSTAGSLGIKLVRNPPNAAFDIVLIHGLTGNRDETWQHQTWTSENKRSLPEYLAIDFPNARIMVYGYDANVLNFREFWKNPSTADLGSYGGGFAVSIRDCRPTVGTDTTPAVAEARPIFFIAHSLGGLVTEQALMTCINGDKSLAPLAAAARGVIFLGVPHEGSEFAKYAGLLARCLPSAIWKTNTGILRALETDNIDIYTKLEQPFQRAAKQGSLKHIQLYSFYETKPVPMLSSLIVSHKSASTAADYDGSIEADHKTMTKFMGRQDPGYMLVKGQLKIMVDEDERQTKAKADEERNRNALSARPNIQGSTFHGTIKTHTFDARVQSAGRSIITNNYGRSQKGKGREKWAVDEDDDEDGDEE